MRPLFLIVCLLISTVTFGQQKEAADKLVGEGIVYHDKGDYDAALAKYDQALKMDKDNLVALAEKSYSLVSLGKYEEGIKYCQKAIETHPGEKNLKLVYITYGNALDALKKADKALEIYDQGIKQFPDFYMLYFNRGITLAGIQKFNEALICFQTALLLHPEHAGSHNAIAKVLKAQDKNIPALLAQCRFLVLEPEGGRAEENLAAAQEIMKGNVEKTGKNSVKITVSPEMSSDSTTDGQVKENNFSTVDFFLSMTSALDYDKKYKKETDIERFIRKLESVCSVLKEQKEENTGFYWEYYVPYFIAMNDQQLVETFAYVAFASSKDKEVAKWLKAHGDKIDKFYAWSEAFQWKQ